MIEMTMMTMMKMIKLVNMKMQMMMMMMMMLLLMMMMMMMKTMKTMKMTVTMMARMRIMSENDDGCFIVGSVLVNLTFFVVLVKSGGIWNWGLGERFTGIFGWYSGGLFQGYVPQN